MFILKIISALEVAKIRYAIVGGFAMVLHGAVRGTVDLDLLIELELDQFVGFEEVMLSLGFKARLPVDAKMIFQFRKDYIENRNLIAWSFYNPVLPHELVDVIITEDLKRKKIVRKSFAGHKICVIAISDLIKMKKKAGRPQDLADIESLRLILKE